MNGSRAIDRTLVPIAISEVLTGLMLGFVLRLLVSAGDTMGEMVGQATGLNGAALFDPGAEGHETAISRVVTVLAAWLLLATGAHRVALSILLESFRAIPIGTLVAPGNSVHVLVDLTTRVMAAGARMALPVVAVSLVLQLGLAMIARAAPSLQIFNVGFSLLIGGGLLVLIDVLPDAAQSMVSLFATLPSEARLVFEAATTR